MFKSEFWYWVWYRADSKYSIEKGETDRHLIDGINSCKKYNLRTAGNVIIGLPGETFDEAFESIKNQ